MGGFSPKNIGVKVLVMGILLLATSMSVSAQMYDINQFMSGIVRVQWKWMADEIWNSTTNSWDKETTNIYNYSGGTSSQPAELIIKTASKDGIVKDSYKQVFSYENGKVQTVLIYTYDTVSSSYRSTPYANIKVTWAGNLISKIEEISDLEVLLDMVATFGIDTTINVAVIKALTGLSDLGKMSCEMVMKIVDGKVVEELMRMKISTNPLILSLMKFALSELDYPVDTNWTDFSKSVITHGISNRVYDNYMYDSEKGQLSLSLKDSLVLDGEKFVKGFNYKLDTSDGSWNLFSKDSFNYDLEDNLLENVTTHWSGLSWVNFYRSVYHYTDYPASAIRFSSRANIRKPLKAAVTSSNNKPVVNFAIDNNSPVAIQLCNLQGKTIGRTIRNSFSAGSHSVTLDNLSQGKYICKIQTNSTSAVIPFQVVR